MGTSYDNSKPKSDSNYLRDMMQGRKKYQRRQWVRDQFIYFGTKYLSSDLRDDFMWFRCNTPQGTVVVAPKYDLIIRPYCDMYIDVEFDNVGGLCQVIEVDSSGDPIEEGVYSRRAKANHYYKAIAPVETATDLLVSIFGGSRVKELSDLSACYIRANSFSAGEKLTKLVIGNTTTGYNNAFITALNIGSNSLLEELDVRNCGNLMGALNLATYVGLQTLYAEGTKLSAVTFATNGKIELAHLPDTITALVMRNLSALTAANFSCDMDNLTNLTIEGGNLDNLDIVEDVIDTLETLNAYRVNWSLDDNTLLESIYNLLSSQLTGQIHLPIIRQRYIDKYIGESGKWDSSKLSITADTILPEYKVTFLDENTTTVLTDTYVDIGTPSHDPIFMGHCLVESGDDAGTVDYDNLTIGSGTPSILASEHDDEYYYDKTNKKIYLSDGTDWDLVATGDIALPTKASTAKFDRIFSHWAYYNNGVVSDTPFDFSQTIIRNTTLVAVYKEVYRKFTINWWENRSDIGVAGKSPLHTETEVEYGSSIDYTPTNRVLYTPVTVGATEYVISKVFTGWDWSTGFVQGYEKNGSFVDVIDVAAVWDEATIYKDANGNLLITDDLNNKKKMHQMSFAEIAAVINSGQIDKRNDQNHDVDSPQNPNFFIDKDSFDIVWGHDFSFLNVPEVEVVSLDDYKALDGVNDGVIPTMYQETVDGKTVNKVDFTGQQGEPIKLFAADSPSFTLAVNYMFLKDGGGYAPTNNATLLSCFENPSNGDDGFRLRYNTSSNQTIADVQWGDKNTKVGFQYMEDMLVLRHRQGDDKLYVYAFDGNVSTNGVYADTIKTAILTRTTFANTDAPLTLGGIPEYDSTLEKYVVSDSNKGSGNIHWLKIWFDDLGDDFAQKLASWTRDTMRPEYTAVTLDSTGTAYGSNYYLKGSTTQRAKASFIFNNQLKYSHNMNNSNINAGGWGASNMFNFFHNRFKNGCPTVLESLLAEVKVTANIGSEPTDFDSWFYIPSTGTVNSTSSEDKKISWFTTNTMRLKWRGFIIPRPTSDWSPYKSDGWAKFYGTSEPIFGQSKGLYDPDTNPNGVREGDIWQNGTSANNNSGTGYIFVLPETIKKYNLITTQITTDGGNTLLGGWLSTALWWLRTPISTNTFYYVYSSGVVYSYSGASNTYGCVPCFSIK